jgi:glycosyltransferase involved in cell wall biosynthesis
MHIAYDGKRFFNNNSGLGNYARDLVRIMATHYPENLYELYASKITDRGAEIIAKPSVQVYQPSMAFPLWRQLQMGKAAQTNNAQIFHGTSGELPIFWSKKPIKKIVSICDVIFERFPQYYSVIDRKIHLQKFKHAGKIADKVIAISEQTKQDCIEYLGIPEHKIEVIYLACHEAFKQNVTDQYLQSIKEKYYLPDKFILNVGTIEERKNVLQIVKAINGTNIPLVVVGRKTSYYKMVVQYIINNKMENQVHFIEGINMQELSVIYKLGSMMVYPSRFEGFGLPIIEALYSNIPVITTFNSCFPEVAGKDSLFVNPEDFEDIKFKILQLWNSSDLGKTISAKGLMHAQQYNDDVIAKKWAAIYGI